MFGTDNDQAILIVEIDGPLPKVNPGDFLSISNMKIKICEIGLETFGLNVEANEYAFIVKENWETLDKALGKSVELESSYAD